MAKERHLEAAKHHTEAAHHHAVAVAMHEAGQHEHAHQHSEHAHAVSATAHEHTGHAHAASSERAYEGCFLQHGAAAGLRLFLFAWNCSVTFLITFVDCAIWRDTDRSRGDGEQ